MLIHILADSSAPPLDSSIAGYLIGAGGSAGLALLLVLLKQLIPGYYHNKVVEQFELLQAAYDKQTTALSEERALNARLVSSGELNNRLVTALINIANERRELPAIAHPPPEGP